MDTTAASPGKITHWCEGSKPEPWSVSGRGLIFFPLKRW